MMSRRSPRCDRCGAPLVAENAYCQYCYIGDMHLIGKDGEGLLPNGMSLKGVEEMYKNLGRPVPEKISMWRKQIDKLRRDVLVAEGKYRILDQAGFYTSTEMETE